jgi:glutamate N-acetyltransferase / amino-acid N-acetyltransferase
MNANLTEIPGSITAPKGFTAAGVFCDIKRLGTGKGSDKGPKRDLALIVSDLPATVAGMFTTNQTCAAPVKVCIERIQRRRAQAIVVNSGNANACTGRQGLRDAKAMALLAEQALNLPAGSVLVASTGRIGVTLPMDNVQSGIIKAAAELGATADHANQVMEAIMTSDTRPKQIAVEFKFASETIRLGGICKGAGMIQPGMSPTGWRPASFPLHATMLCFITTDASIAPKPLQAALREAVAASFNRITVDGDMSTNDTVLVLANGHSSEGNDAPQADRPAVLHRAFRLMSRKSKGFAPFQAALSHVCLELAKQIVRDGEGVSRFVTVRLQGARTFTDAEAAARSVANSPLVKTSWHGGDPNWGRIIAALGYSSASVTEEKVDIGYSTPASPDVLWSLKRGQPTRATFQDLCAAVAPREFDLHINLNLGSASTLIYAADLTEDYVAFNKGDVTDPTSLGG